jgi:hypothetical protein
MKTDGILVDDGGLYLRIVKFWLAGRGGACVVRVEPVVFIYVIKFPETEDRVKKNDGIILNDTKKDGEYK